MTVIALVRLPLAPHCHCLRHYGQEDGGSGPRPLSLLAITPPLGLNNLGITASRIRRGDRSVKRQHQQLELPDGRGVCGVWSLKIVD